MPDSIGNIAVPSITPVGTFPLTTDYPHNEIRQPDVFVHSFGSANAKIEQRFWRGDGARRFMFRRNSMSPADRESLSTFWLARQGAYESFTYNAHLGGHSAGTTAVTCRFANPSLTYDQALQHATTVGIEIVEEITTGPTHTLNSTLTRFPSAALDTALLNQVQEIIPLIHIVVNESGYIDNIFLSDRRVTVGSQLYLARLLDWNGIEQSINAESDFARFIFGDADNVMTDLVNDTDIWRARVDFSLFHVGEGIKLDYWSGFVSEFDASEEGSFRIDAVDRLAALTLPYPRRRIGRRCWKIYDGGVGSPCDFFTNGSLDGSFPSADALTCDRSFGGPNGCDAHNMEVYFGGIEAKPQAVRIKDNSKGTWGHGRPNLTVASIVSDSVYGQSVPEIFTDVPMQVEGKIVSGRDESEFYDVLALIGEGPIGAFGTGHRLDGSVHHGPGALGLRTSLGPDPNSDAFGLSQTDPPTSGDVRAAGTAFIELRKNDPVGLQLSRAEDHQLVAVISVGRKGFTWSAGPTRNSNIVLTNPFWVAVNTFLRALYLEFETASNQEEVFDFQSALDAAAIADTTVSRIIGSGTVKQWKFIGIIGVERPLREWLTEILNNALGYFSFEFGKLKFGIRNDSSVVEAYTTGNIVWRSLKAIPVRPHYNHITAHFGDEEFEFQPNSVELNDFDHAIKIGFKGNPTYLKQDINLAGTSTKDQAARLITVMLREEIGGVNAGQWRNARIFTFKTTVLALSSEVGQVISITHPNVPSGGPVEARIKRFRLNRDYSIDVTCRTTHDDMYDLTVGDKPGDAVADPVPGEIIAELVPPDVTSFAASEDAFVEQDGTVRSAVTVTYNEPSPLGTFKGVAIYVAELDTDLVDGSGAITEEAHEITRIPQNASPETRRFILDTLIVSSGVSGAMRLWAPSFSNSRLNDYAAAPTIDVLLDGKDSAPTAVADLWCQTGIKDGLRLRWDRNPERDLGGYRIADTGNVVPASDSDITSAQVIATYVPDPGADHAQFDFIETLYRGVSNTTVVTLGKDATEQADAAARFFPASAHVIGGTGKNVQFINSDGTVTNLQVVSNTERTITFAGGTVPNGQVKFFIRGSNGVHNLYVQPFDKSGNDGLWAPAPPSILSCSPLSIDGTKDITVPNQPWNDGTITIQTSWFGVHPKTIYPPGILQVQVAVRSDVDSVSDFDLADKLNINGLIEMEIVVRHSSDGVTNLVDTCFPFSIANTRESYTHFAGPPFNGWVFVNIQAIPLANQGVDSVKARVKNSHGWSEFTDIAAWAPPGSKPWFVGGVTTQAMLTVAVDPVVSNTFVPNLAESFSFLIDDPAADFTVKKPNYRGSGGLDATGDVPTGLETIEVTHLNGATPRVASFDSEYKGVDSTHAISSPFVGGWVTWRFKIESATFYRLVNYFHHNPTA